MRQRQALLLFSVLGVGTLLGTWLVPPQDAAAPVPPRADPSLARIERRLDALTNDVEWVTELEEERLAAVDIPPPSVATREPDEGAAFGDPKEVLPELHAAMRDQSRDPAWERDAEAALRAELGTGAHPGLDLLDLECAGKLCRARVHFGSPELQEARLRELPGSLPWSSAGMFVDDPEDPGTTLLFITREGTSLSTVLGRS